MLAVVYQGPRAVQVEEIPEPKKAGNRSLIRMRNASICGTDLHFYTGEWSARKGIILGHDASGDIVETGERVALEFIGWCGSCGFCRQGRENLCERTAFMGFDRNGFFAQEIVLPNSNTYPLPDEVGDEEGACLEPAALAVHTLNHLNPKARDWVTILGQGAVGLCMTQVAKERKCKVIAVDLHDYRLKLAERFGADLTVNATEEDTEKTVRSTTGGGSHFVIEATGSRSTVEQTPRLVKSDGRVALVGAANGEIDFKDEALFSGILAYTVAEKKQALKMVADGAINLRTLITHRYALSQFHDAVKTALDPSKKAVKILLHP